LTNISRHRLSCVSDSYGYHRKKQVQSSLLFCRWNFLIKKVIWQKIRVLLNSEVSVEPYQFS